MKKLAETTLKSWGIKHLAALLPAVVIVGILFLPDMLHGGEALTPLKFTVSEQEGSETLTLHGSFEVDLPENTALWLYAEHAALGLRTEGVSAVYNGREGTPALFRSPGSGWYRFNSPGIRAGDEVEWTVRSYYGESGRAAEILLSRLCFGDGSGLYRRLLGQIDFFAIVLFCAFIAGMIYTVEGAIDISQGSNTEGTRIFLFGFYMFTGGLWCVTDVMYPYLGLLISPRWLVALLDALGLLLFPVALAVMMRHYIHRKWTRRIMNGIVALESSTALFCTVRQLAGTADLLEQQSIISIAALISIGTAMLCSAVEFWHSREGYQHLLLLTVLPIFISSMVDGANVFWPFMPRRTLMRYSFSLSVFLLILQLFSYARAEFLRSRKLREMEKELEDSRVAMMLSQLQPHFLYNCLLGMKQLCETDPMQASEALGHFSFYLRGNLDSLVDKKLISFEKEMEHVGNYLYLEEMRFGERLGVRFELEYQDFLLPPLTVQPLVENAVRYGITKKKKGGTVTIRSEFSNGAAIITVCDDGVGFALSERREDGRTHTGIDNVRGRLDALCGGTLLVRSEKGVGTEVRIILPQNKKVQPSDEIESFVYH